jgi:hypothetical protein
MTSAEFIARHEQLYAQIKKECSDVPNNCLGVEDGAIDPKLYLESKIKIAWVLKESYDQEGNEVAGQWAYRDFLGQEHLYANFITQTGAKPMWSKIAYATYSLLQDEMPLYDDITFLDKDPSIAEFIHHVAVVNTKKTPAVGRVLSNDGDIADAFQKNKAILGQQFALLRPQIVIGGNVLSLYRDLFGLQEPTGYLHYQERPYYFKDNTLYIDAYHPAYWVIDVEKYVDDIILVARKYFSRAGS